MGSRLAALPIVLLVAVPAQAREKSTLPRISSYFGARSDPFHGQVAVHRGLDMPGPLGTTVMAAAAGTVRFAGRRGGYGNMVEITHADGSVTRYGHLSRILVAPGMAVAQGEAIALMGSTGRSTGSHLHFELLVNGQAVDPLRYLGGAIPASHGSGAAYPVRRADAAPESPFRSAFSRARDAVAPANNSTALPGGLETATDRPRNQP